MYQFKIEIGDRSGDGHGISESFVISSNKPVAFVQQMYLITCNQLGFSLDDYKHNASAPCAEYEDSKFPLELLEKIAELGINITKDDIEYLMEEYMYPEMFVKFILEFAKFQDPSLELKIIEDAFPKFHDDFGNRRIGWFGYGLFDNF